MICSEWQGTGTDGWCGGMGDWCLGEGTWIHIFMINFCEEFGWEQCGVHAKQSKCYSLSRSKEFDVAMAFKAQSFWAWPGVQDMEQGQKSRSQERVEACTAVTETII